MRPIPPRHLSGFRSTSRARRSDDRGLAIVMVSVMMLVLLAFVGFAVDVGLVYNERRQAQSAADTAALAAVQDPSLDEAWDTIFRVVNASGDTTYTETDWNTDANCPAVGELPAGMSTHVQTATTRGSGTFLNTNCIAYAGTLGQDDYRLFVRVPTVEVDAVFAGLVGADSFKTSAFAIAGFGEVINNNRNVFPFAVSDTHANGESTCFIQPPGGLANDFCPGPDQGNFGPQSMYRVTLNWCGSGHTNANLRNNLAMGMDHNIDSFDPQGVPFPANEMHGDAFEETCANAYEPPNALRPLGGGNYSGGIIPQGLMAATGGGTGILDNNGGRLRRYPASDGIGPWPTFDFVVGGTTWASLDNKPLWEFIEPQGAGRIFGGDWVRPLDIAFQVPIGPPTSTVSPQASNTVNGTGDLIHEWDLQGADLPRICNPGLAVWTEDHRDDDVNPATPSTDDDGLPGFDPRRQWPWNYSRMVHCMYAVDHSTTSETLLSRKTIDPTPESQGGKYDIEYSTRFGWVPESHRVLPSYLLGTSRVWEIKRFRSAFINDIIYTKSSNNQHCFYRVGEGRISLGDAAACGGGTSLRSLNSIMLDTTTETDDQTMLPDSVANSAPGLKKKPQPSLLR